MLKFGHRTKAATDQNQETVTAVASLQTVKTLFSVGLGCITFIRGLLSDDNFETRFLTSSREPSVLEVHGSQNISSNTKIKTIKRGFSTEADSLLDYLENGIFDALEKQFLKSFVFAIYLDQRDPNNLVESYTFNVSYHQIGSTGVRVPTLSIETSLSQLNLASEDPLAAAAENGRPPTLGDVKKSIRAMIRKLVSVTQSMDALPDRRFATFKIYYHDDTPQEYEPPNFVPGDAEKDRFFFATHNVHEAPERSACGEVNTGVHAVRLEVASICSHLPSIEDHTGTFTGHTSAQTFDEVDGKRRADAVVQLADAANRQVIWDADPSDEDAPSDVDPDYRGSSEAPLGVRRGEEVVPIPWKPAVRHKAGKHHVPALDNASSSDAAQVEEATQLLETQATVVIPQSAGGTQMEVDLNQHQEEDVDMNDGGTNTTAPGSTPTPAEIADDDAMAERRIHPAIDPVTLCEKNVDCDCKIDDETCESFICQGPCGRRLHAWCMGFETAEEAAYSQDSTCVTCIVQTDLVYDIMSDNNKHALFVELSVLAIYRRTLKLVYENGYPGNLSQLQKLIRCTRSTATKNLTRMENEGFLESRVIELDSLGLVASDVPAKNTKKKANKKNQPKPQLVPVKSAAAMKKLKRYFEPEGELVQELVKSYRPKKDKVVPPAQSTPAGNVLVPSSSANLPSQEPSPSPAPTLRGTSPHESQTQQETQTFIEPPTPPPITPSLTPALALPPPAPSKRRISTRLSENQAKKMKISLAKQGVDLETYD